MEDTTLNVLPAASGKHLMALGEGGFQYLLAGARGSVGLTGGRYMFEVMITENRNLADSRGGGAQGPAPKNYLRVGFATEESSLLLNGVENFFFDGLGKGFRQGQVVAVLLNLEAAGPNSNTISLFCDGKRVTDPKPLPESMKGKALYPAVTYRNAVLQVNFGPNPLRPLPFKCLTLQEAPASNATVKKAAATPKDGKHQVLVPVGLPDEGTFDWLDQFLAKNKGFVEVSDRALLDWAERSGCKNGGKGHLNKKSCNDKPEFTFGLQLLDNYSVQKVLATIAPLMPRNLVVMEVKQNLTVDGRKQVLTQFPSSNFKRVATVVVGDPPAEWKSWVQEDLLKEKKAKAEAQVARKKAELAKKKLAEEAKRKREEDKKQAERERAAKKAKEAKGAAAGDEGKEEDGAEEKHDEDRADKGEEEKEGDAPEEPEEDVVVELTEEDKQRRFRRKFVHDLTPKVFSSSYAEFTLPSKEEGFDDITYAWQKEAKCKEYLTAWISEKKLTQRVEDLQVSDWFKTKHSEWTKLLGSWKKKQQEFKFPAKGKGKQPWAPKKKQEKKPAVDDAKEEEEKKEAEVKADMEVEEEVKDGEAKEEELEEEKPKINAAELDVFDVEDVTDIGNGEPLFAHFSAEDWAMMSLRFELHLLMHAFRHDLDDSERQTFHERHLGYYYNKYFGKNLSAKSFGESSYQELIKVLEDTVEIDAKNTLEAQMSEDTPLDNFVRLTEDDRRERQRRVDTGDAAAAFKFSAAPQWGGGGQKGKGGGKGGQGARGSVGSSYDSGAKRSDGASGSGPPAKRPAFGGARVGYAAPPPPPPTAARGRGGYGDRGNAGPGGYGGGYARDSGRR